MSTPRRPFGSALPGRLQATMVKVLAAEMSDPGRLGRGKRYHADDAVTDITIGRGVATAGVQGGRAEPYVVTIEAEPGDGVPRRGEVWVSCTCPDDTGTGADACKHAVAALLTLATEISIEPDLLERWRSGSARHSGRVRATPSASTPPPTPSPTASSTPSNVIDLRSGQPVEPDAVEPSDGSPAGPARPKDDDLISPMLRAPQGDAVPRFGPVDPLDHPRTGDETLDDVIDDALRHLRIRWD